MRNASPGYKSTSSFESPEARSLVKSSALRHRKDHHQVVGLENKDVIKNWSKKTVLPADMQEYLR